ncbi:MAG TPA: type II toxin-antitoxin system HicA family toxin [Anaerolineales bacterium]|nr:type II toxin-antitoxin system HicA family toxin [Anaerolineales bacterium]
MSKLPRISGRECIRALEKAGFYIKRQKGSHVTLRRDDPFPMSSPPAPYSPHSHLLCGPHPLRPGRETLDSLLASGVTCFIDLTEPGELPSYQFSAGSIQFSELANQRESESAREPLTINHPQLPITHYRFPIPDFSTPTPSQMTSILNTLDSALAEGHTVYLHCHGGRGRTGTVVGCWLVRHRITGEQALARIAELRGDNESPETDEQRAFVLSWNSTQMAQITQKDTE